MLRRAAAILRNPDEEWIAIEREDAPIRPVLAYVAALAPIPALCGFVGTSLVGVTVSAGTFKVPAAAGLVNAAASYALSFALVGIVALAINLLAPSFRTAPRFAAALKLSAYSFTPAWLAGIFLLLPQLRFLTVLGLYGFYLLWSGLGPMLGTPRDRSLMFAAAVLVCALAAVLLLATVQDMLVRAIAG